MRPAIMTELQRAIWLEVMFAQWLPLRMPNPVEYDPSTSQWLARHWFAREIEGRN